MSEGIEFHGIGTVDVTFDDKTYHLGRPKFRQFKHFTQRLEDVRLEAQDRAANMIQRAAEADRAHAKKPTDATQAEIDAIKAESRAIRDDPFYNRTMDLVAEMFEQVGDPLPEDRDDWPAFLADPKLPGDILSHWQTRPKASGAAPKT